ncbi:MAG: restriction endonuclease [Nocardioidaceae bacterium]
MGIYRLGLVTFPDFFQCKRYKGSVGPDAVRDFRGAMSGRGDKGLLITTGTFTSEAQRESVRQGTTPVDLIDGESLCNLLKRYELGVSTKVRQEDDVSIDPPFFTDI